MSELLDELGRVLTNPPVTDQDVMRAYARDQCVLGVEGLPLAVVRAQSAADVVATMKTAAERRIPVVTRGRGTGLAGGANALDGSIMLVLERLDRIIDLDPVGRTAKVEAGVLNGALDNAARSHGLFYAPDPGSRDISSIGGNIATNAGGMCCAKYGVTADHVMQLTAVLPGGDTIRTGSLTRKDVAGLDLTRLLVGSEGTLAVIVDATVRLLPIPEQHATVAATFRDVRNAIESVLALSGTVVPSAVELMDRTTVRAINAMTRMGLDEEAGAVMLIQCEGPHAGSEALVCTKILENSGAVDVIHTDDPADGHALMQARRVAYTALERLGTALLDDVCVPVRRLPDLFTAIEKISADHSLLIGTFGHAADGNLHPTIVFDPSDSDAANRAQSAFARIVEEALALDGTISGEHGIGSLKTPFLSAQLGATERGLMTRIKQAFDPDRILNPDRAY